jgi:SAM-dependent methyltransferase
MIPQPDSQSDERGLPDVLTQFPLRPPLPLPAGHTEESMMEFFASIEIEGAPKEEMYHYWRQDWRRFVYTLWLAGPHQGNCLELGANPYYTTLLLRCFTDLKLTLANFFSDQFAGPAEQMLRFTNPVTGLADTYPLTFFHFNIEREKFPFPDRHFDLVLCCEIIEHLQHDPIQVLREIKRILKPSGHLVLTTPNVSRLENVCRMIAGVNIYDPYSGYGAYGRHNREYNRHELTLLLDYCGFDIDVVFSADVHENQADGYAAVSEMGHLVRKRENDLGQYLFAHARNARPGRTKRPQWLYRSYASDDLEP